MTNNDPVPPVAADDFPEFAEPPRHKPALEPEPEPEPSAEAGDGLQAEVDEVIARLRQKRAEGKN